MLPRIQVNPMNNEIGISGGGELQIRINGVKADINEIKALRPADIIRIEYHDNPGLRYGNAEIVLDYIVRRPIRRKLRHRSQSGNQCNVGKLQRIR